MRLGGDIIPAWPMSASSCAGLGSAGMLTLLAVSVMLLIDGICRPIRPLGWRTSSLGWPLLTLRFCLRSARLSTARLQRYLRQRGLLPAPHWERRAPLHAESKAALFAPGSV